MCHPMTPCMFGDRPLWGPTLRSTILHLDSDLVPVRILDSASVDGVDGADRAGAPNWFGRSVFVNYAFFNRYGFRRGFARGFRAFGGRTIWAHDLGHRLGVPYPSRQLGVRFQGASTTSRRNIGRSGGMNSSNRSFGNRNSFQSARPGGSSFYRGRSAFRGGQNYRGGTSRQGGARGFQSPRAPTMPSFQSSPRSLGPAASRGFGGGARSFGGNRSFSGGGRSARSSGGGGHGSGGGGGHSFGGISHGGGRR